MKIFILTFLLLVAPCRHSYSQSFKLADDFSTLANGADLYQSGPSDTLQLITWLHLTNHSASTIDVSMKKQEISMLPGGSSSICWGGYCYGPEMMVSTFPLAIAPGETVSGCFGHFGPNGCRGVSVVRWVFFNNANPSDSLSVTVHYSTFPAATGQVKVPQFTFSSAGMVPADNQIVLRYSVPKDEPANVVLYNESGRFISSCGGLTGEGTVKFNTAELPSGVYFCTLVLGGKPTSTKKIPVRH
ncbi:MAG: T9SS type A sorting domain-containing protein [bacterium]